MLGCASSTETPAPVLNPSDLRDVVGHVQEATVEDVDNAIQCALNAAPIWQATPPAERAAILERAADLMEGEIQPLMGLLAREAGKTFANAIAEVREAVDFLRYYAVQARNDFTNDAHRPLGPVVCISPWNFPLAIFSGQVAAALAAGNPVLAKPAEQTPLVAAQAVRLLLEAGIPEGVLQLLPGRGETVGARLVGDDRVKGVMFTGSTDVARIIARTLADRLDDAGHTIPLIAETGGQNAMVVDSSALSEQVVFDVLTSAFDSAGQRCSALRVLCVQEDCADHVLTMLRGALRELQVGRTDILSADVGPVIDLQAQAGIQAHIQAMRDAGHRVDQLELDSRSQHGSFVAPTIIEIGDVAALKKEVFGPVLHVLRYQRNGLDALIDAINATGYGLTFGVHTRLDETVARVSERIHAGNIYVNRNIVGAVVGVQPFGGEGLSGTGPKAGGPLYLRRLLSMCPPGLPAGCDIDHGGGAPLALDGPTGESNLYHVKPRGTVLCVAATELGASAQFDACRLTGNRMALLDSDAGRAFFAARNAAERKTMRLAGGDEIEQGDYQAVLFEGDSDALRGLNQAVARRHGPIVSVQGLSSDELAAGHGYRLERLLREVSVSVNTAAAGGNASLMMVG